MIDKEIIISKLRSKASIGINPNEQINKQDIELNITIYLQDNFIIEQDQIDSTIDYNEIKQNIEAIIQKKHYNLQETLVREVGEYCLTVSPVIEKVDVKLSKLSAYDNCIVSFSASFIANLSK